MTVVSNQLNQSRAAIYCLVILVFTRLIKTKEIKFCLTIMNRGTIFVTVFLVSFLYICGATRYDDKAEYIDGLEDASSVGEKEEVSRTGVFFKDLLKEQPRAVVLELSNPLLETVQKLWGEDTVTLSMNEIILSAFDPKGLQGKTSFNDSSKLFQAIENLKVGPLERRDVTPTMHVLNEVIKMTSSEGPVILMTMSKPSDEDFLETLTQSLVNSKSRLSVLWGGDRQSTDYLRLEELTKKTGGSFFFIEEIGEEELQEGRHLEEPNVETSRLPLNTVQNFSERVRFPEDSTEGSRTANQRAIGKVTVPLIVEVASGTSLEVRPGSAAQIPFTVKNNINVPLQVQFNARYNGILQRVQPPGAILQPSASTVVTVNVATFIEAQSNAVGTVTLYAHAANKVTPRAALIFLSPQGTNDRTEPRLKYKYEGDCSEYRDPKNCENGQWGLEATIYDEDSGILKILSEPYGLFFQSEFVAGTKSPVTVFYSANCCQSKVDIWAEDLKGNYVKKSFDVFNQNLLAGEIAAIVVGVLLLVFLIIAIIIAVVLVKRRNRRNIILPRSSG